MLIGRVLTVLSLVAVLVGCSESLLEDAYYEGSTAGSPATSRYQSCVGRAVPIYAASESPAPMILAQGVVALCREAAGLLSPLTSADDSFESQREVLEYMERLGVLTPESQKALEAWRRVEEDLKNFPPSEDSIVEEYLRGKSPEAQEAQDAKP